METPSAEIPPPPSIDRVLVPVDGSEEAIEAAEYAVAVAAAYGADVHAVYVFGEDVVRAIETGVVDHDDVADESGAMLETVEAIGDDRGVETSCSTVYGFSTRRKTHHPGTAVLDTAEDVGADFLVVPRERQTGEPSAVLAKAAEYVLLYATQPLLSV